MTSGRFQHAHIPLQLQTRVKHGHGSHNRKHRHDIIADVGHDDVIEVGLFEM